MKSAIKVKGLTKTYHGVTANDNITTTIPEGVIYGLVGRNGAGKTTFMKALLGITVADAGEIEILGYKGKELDKARQETGFIIENPVFYDNLTVMKNLIIRAKLYGVANPKERAEKVLKLVGLFDKRDVKVKGLSLGMRQSLGIAAAIVHNPKLLILDEPVNGLDPVAIAFMREIFVDLNKKGTTIIISSHILGELQKLATCYGFIVNGKLVEEMSEKDIEENGIDLEQKFIELAKESL